MLHKWREALRRLLVRLGLIRPGKIMYIGGSDTLPPPLNREEEAALLARLDAGEEAVRQTLIERNLRPDQGHQYLPHGQKYQAGHLRQPMH